MCDGDCGGDPIYWGGDGLSGGPPSKWTGFFVLLLIGLVFVGAVIKIVRRLFTPGGDFYDYIMAALWVVFLAALSVGGIIILLISIKERVTKCEHGVRGGAYKGRCRKCMAHRIEKQKADEAYKDNK